MGYSMGARIAAFLALRDPQRVHSAVFGGLGRNLIDGTGVPDEVAEALLAPSPAAVSDPRARLFRVFAEQTKSDLRALAACVRGSRQTLDRAQIAAIQVPVLVAVGSLDEIGGPAAECDPEQPRRQRKNYSGDAQQPWTEVGIGIRYRAPDKQKTTAGKQQQDGENQGRDLTAAHEALPTRGGKPGRWNML